jgi:hypothetical protein
MNRSLPCVKNASRSLITQPHPHERRPPRPRSPAPPARRLPRNAQLPLGALGVLGGSSPPQFSHQGVSPRPSARKTRTAAPSAPAPRRIPNGRQKLPPTPRKGPPSFDQKNAFPGKVRQFNSIKMPTHVAKRIYKRSAATRRAPESSPKPTRPQPNRRLAPGAISPPKP